MKLGAENRRNVIILGALVVIGAYLKFSDSLSGSSSSAAHSAPPAAVRQAPVPAETPQPARPAARPSSRSRVQSDEFHPVLHPKRPEDRIDPAKVDPTLRLDLLAKVQNSEVAGGGRNVFQFAPKALPPEPSVLPTPVASVAAPPAPPPSGPPPPPPLPPITLRYYGFTSAPGSNAKTAFFLDGDEILVAKEGDTVKRRYRVVRVGATSAVLEDTESKRQQTIPLAEEAAG